MRAHTEVREFTARAVLTGMAIGAVLTPCNVYSGLKIGWSFNMSIAAGLLAVGVWSLANRAFGTPRFGLLENNINQTTASSAASIISGGLVAPIPALTILTGVALDWGALALWVFAVSILGVIVAASLRRQMIEVEDLPFPAGTATAETMTRIHGSGAQAWTRLRVLFAAAALSGGLKLFADLVSALPRLAPAFAIPIGAGGRSASFQNLGLSLDPSLLMIGFGAIVGLRVGLSALAGAVLAWGVLAPIILARGWAEPGGSEALWFGPLVAWLLWPGVTLIVVSTLVSFGMALGGVVARRHGALSGARPSLVSMGAFMAIAALIAVTAQVLFGLGVLETLLAVGVSFVLAVVAARVTGETGITPIGALGKVTQLSYGAVSPGDVTANLMSANVTGGAAGQCADLMHDLKTGRLIGATAKLQLTAQAFGVLTGSVVGSLIYLVLIPDPAVMLLTPEWPAPAVATWKAVAEVLSEGLGSIPDGAVPAMVIAAVIGALMAVVDRLASPRVRRVLPSAPAIGLAFVIPAWNSVSLFLGALLAWALRRAVPAWAETRTLPLAAGLVAGESLAGVAVAFASLLG